MEWTTSTTNIIINIANNILPLQNLISGLAYLIGISFIVKALYSLKVYGEARSMMSSNSSIKEPAIYILVGSLLIYTPTAVEIMMNTTFGYSTILSYAPIGGSSWLGTFFGSDTEIQKPLMLIVQIVGLYAFIRGWVLIARAASQGQPPGGTGKGLVHVFGGILAMNIVGTIQVINNTIFGSG